MPYQLSLQLQSVAADAYSFYVQSEGTAQVHLPAGRGETQIEVVPAFDKGLGGFQAEASVPCATGPGALDRKGRMSPGILAGAYPVELVLQYVGACPRMDGRRGAGVHKAKVLDGVGRYSAESCAQALQHIAACRAVYAYFADNIALPVHNGRNRRGAKLHGRAFMPQCEGAEHCLVVARPHACGRESLLRRTILRTLTPYNIARRAPNFAFYGFQRAAAVVVDEIDALPLVAERRPGELGLCAGRVVAWEGEARVGQRVRMHHPVGVREGSLFEQLGAVPGDYRPVVVPKLCAFPAPVQVRWLVEVAGKDYIQSFLYVAAAASDEIAYGVVSA